MTTATPGLITFKIKLNTQEKFIKVIIYSIW